MSEDTFGGSSLVWNLAEKILDGLGQHEGLVASQEAG